MIEVANENENVVVTLKDIYVELRRLQDTVAAMTPQSVQINDHEGRLRALERWRYALPTSLLLALGSSGLAVAEIVIHH